MPFGGAGCNSSSLWVEEESPQQKHAKNLDKNHAIATHLLKSMEHVGPVGLIFSAVGKTKRSWLVGIS